METHKTKFQPTAMNFIILMGIVSLFSDMTHEGARSIIGEYLNLTGASASTIGFISGLGEMLGYSLRLISGFMTDKTKKYWTFILIGYGLQAVAIPLLALIPKNGMIIACCLITVERIGKAIKKPAKNSLVSFAASEVGAGKGFGYQEFLDQLGAFIGPVLLFVIASIKGSGKLFSTYRICFAVLAIPAVITMAVLFYAKNRFACPEIFEKEKFEGEKKFVLKKAFAFYIAAICLFAFGFADFTIITLHAAKTGLFSPEILSLLYAGAMAADAVSALYFGRLFDKIGLKSLILSTLLSSCFAIFVFIGNSRGLIIIGIVLWGIGMGAQESIMKAAVSKIVSKSARSSGFGIFETGFGIAWFLGSWVLGVLYDINPVYLVIVSSSAQLSAIIFYLLCIKTYK